MTANPLTTLHAIDTNAINLAAQIDAECDGDHWPASHITFLRQAAFHVRCIAEMAAATARQVDAAIPVQRADGWFGCPRSQPAEDAAMACFRKIGAQLDAAARGEQSP